MSVRRVAFGQVLLKTMDTTTPSSEKVEFFTLKR